jgi:hypothetical protein
MARPKKDDRLSPLARKAEATLKRVLDLIAKDFEAVEKAGRNKDGTPRQIGQYTLTDFMKVADRALKLEAIRLSVKDDDSGSFFTQAAEEPDLPTEDEGADDGDE